MRKLSPASGQYKNRRRKIVTNILDKLDLVNSVNIEILGRIGTSIIQKGL